MDGSEDNEAAGELASLVPEMTASDAGVNDTEAVLLTNDSHDQLELSGGLPVVGADPRWSSFGAGSGPGDSADDVRLLEPIEALSDVSLADSGFFHAMASGLDEPEPLVVTSTEASAASTSSASARRNGRAGGGRSGLSSDTWSSPRPGVSADRGGQQSRMSSLPVPAYKGHAPAGPADDGPPRSGASQRALAALQSIGRPAPVHASGAGLLNQSTGPAMVLASSQHTPAFQMPAFAGSAFGASPGTAVWPGGSETTTTATMNGTATQPVLSTTQSGSAVIQITSRHPETAGGQTSSTSPEGLPTDDALTGEREARLERALERFREAREAAFKTLAERATAAQGAAPRGLARRIEQLQCTPQDQVEKIAGLIRELGESRSTAALSTLSAFSQKPQKEIRTAVAEALGRIKDDGSAILLMRLSSDKSGTVVESALRSLVALSIDATLPVIVMAALCRSGLRTLVTSLVEVAPDETKPVWEQRLLADAVHSDPEVVSFAVSTLVRLTGAAHFDHYMRLADHESPVVRAAAVEALARTEVKRAISRLNEALQDPSAQVRAQAALAMSAFHSPKSVELLSGLLSDPEVSVRRNAALSLSRMDEEGMSDVLADALSRETDSCTVESLLAAVNRNGDARALPVLTRYIESEDAEFRDQALKALRRLKLPESTPLFRRLLADPAASLRRQSAEQLGVLQCKAALPQLRELLKRDSDETVRAACAKTIAELQDPSALPLLEEALEDVSAVRLQAVIGLGHLGQPAAGPLLIRLLHDVRPEIRYQAARSLAALKLEDSTLEIERLLEDPDELVRRGAETALSELGVSRGRQQWKVFERKSVRWLSRLAPGRLAAMIPGGPAVFLSACLLIAAIVPLGVWWSVSGADTAAVLPVTSVTGVSISGDGSVCAAVRKRDVIDVWDTQTGELKDRFAGPPGVAAVVLNGTGDEVLLVTMSGIIRRKVGDESESLPAPQAGTEFQGSYLGLQRNPATGTVSLFLKQGDQLRIMQLDMATLSVKWDRLFRSGATSRGFVSRSEEFAAVPGVATQLEIFDVKTSKRFMVDLARLFGESDANGVAAIKDVCFSDDQKRLAVVRPGKPVSIIDVETMRPVAELLKGQPVSAAQVRFQPESHDLMVICAGGEVCRITNEFTAESIQKVDGLPPFTYLSLSDDGRFLVSAQDEERALVTADVEAGKVLHTMPGQS
jgi:HEAT repeat protein